MPRGEGVRTKGRGEAEASTSSRPSSPPPTPRWLLQTPADVPADDAWLTPEERARLAAFHVPKRRAEWRLGRWTAKRALAAVLGLPKEALPRIAVRAAADGAPEAFVDDAPSRFTISISHRAERALAVVARTRALGCDLEWIEPRSAAFVRDYFAPSEQALVAAAADPALAANLVWTGKESALKALRAGLRLDPRRVVVRLSGGAERAGWRPLAVHGADRATFHGWWRRVDGHVLSVVADPPPAVPQPV